MWSGVLRCGLRYCDVVWGTPMWSGVLRCGLGYCNVVWGTAMWSVVLRCGLGYSDVVWGVITAPNTLHPSNVSGRDTLMLPN